jgi:hypothetical protein
MICCSLIVYNIVVYISYVIDASRGVPKVITDGTHAPPISVKIVGEPQTTYKKGEFLEVGKEIIQSSASIITYI